MKNEELKNSKKIKTTGQLRIMLAEAAQNVLNGSLEIEKATVLHKLAKNISESLYSETKIAMLNNDIGREIAGMGDLSLGGNDENE